MSTVSVREAQRNLSAVLERVAGGESVTITRRGKVIARVVPATPYARRWPDLMGRLTERFPDGPPPGAPASELIDEMRGRDL